MTEPTHGEILRAIGCLEGQLRQLLDTATAHREERSALGERVGRLEARMAQVVVIGAVLALLSPMLWGEVSNWIHDRPAVTAPQRRP